MKKTNFVLLFVIVALFSLYSCEKPKNSDAGDNISVVTTENVSDSNLVLNYAGHTNSLNFDNVSDMYNFADLVVVATPVEQFVDSKQVWRDPYNNAVESVEKAQITHSYTARKFKVNKIYKTSDKNIKEFVLYERAISDDKEVTILNGEYLSKKGNKYLLFLYESPATDGLYLPFYYQGKYDLEADNDQNEQIDKQLFLQVKDEYKEDFKQ